jgi:hypothetical protein
MTLTRRDTIRREVLRKINAPWAVQTVSSGTGTTVAADNLVHRFGDDNALLGDVVYLPDSATADQRRRIDSWDDSSGQATVALMGAAPVATNTLEIYRAGEPFADDINEALDRALQESSRVVWSAIPTIAGNHEYSLADYPWIETADDITDVYLRNSPNLIDNEDFELWGEGSSPALARWTAAGAGLTITRVAGMRHGFAVRITAAGDVDASLTQTPGLLHDQLRGELQSDGTYANPRAVRCSVWAKTSVASGARVSITDGVTTTNSPYHSGGGGWEELVVGVAIGITATTLQFSLQMNEDGDAEFDQAVLMERETGATVIPDVIREQGSQSFTPKRLDHDIITHAPSPVILLANDQPRGRQIIFSSAQPFNTLATDSSLTDMPLSAAIAGTIWHLATTIEPYEDRARWDRLQAFWGPRYRRWQERLAEIPGPDISAPQVTVGVR